MRPILLLVAVTLIGCGEDCPTGPGEGVSIVEVGVIEDWKGTGGTYAVVLVTDLKGSPLANKRVDWEVVEGNDVLIEQSALTNQQGQAGVRIRTILRATEKIKATVFGYNVSVEIEYRIVW